MHKKLILLIMICAANTAHADTINVNWMVDGYKYDTTTCTVGGDLILPTPPTPETGYHFVGWEVAGYAKLEYIESTGTQYIDTNLSGFDRNDVEIYAKWQLTTTSQPSNWPMIFGVRPDGEYNAYRIIVSGNYLVASANTVADTPGETSLAYIDTQTHTATLKNKLVVFDGVEYDMSDKTSGAPLPSTASLMLLSRNGVAIVYGRIYGASVKKGGVLSANLVPAKRVSDNAIGMYDTVSHTFFTNQGTGDFIAGPATGEYIY